MRLDLGFAGFWRGVGLREKVGQVCVGFAEEDALQETNCQSTMKWGFKAHLTLGCLIWGCLAIHVFNSWHNTFEPGRHLVPLLFLLSPAVLIPLGWRFGAESERDRHEVWESVCLLLLAFSLLRSQFHNIDPLSALEEPLDDMTRFHGWLDLKGYLKGFCVLPWFLLQTRIAMIVISRWFIAGFPNLSLLCIDVSRIFPAIGSAWLVAATFGWFPFRFDPLIVLLTAVHFHHAGVTLPLIAGLNAKAAPGCWTRFSCVAILLGVPLVAAGIMCTQFGVLPFMEPFGVTILVLGSLGVALSQFARGARSRSGFSVWTRVGFLVSGISLLEAMLLAMAFGLRYHFPSISITMAQMWTTHGTLNAFGFGLCGLLAWRGALKPVNTLKD
jgi:hypothetical protein